MGVFFVSLSAVAVMLLCAVPGFLLKITGTVDERCIPDLSKVLLFVCQPCLIIYTFEAAEFSPEMLTRVGVFALLALLLNAVMLCGFFLLFRKKGKEDAVYRVMTVATTFGNCAFFGIPIFEAIFPETAGSLVIYTTVYATIMNVLGWTVGMAIMADNPKFMSAKKLVLNPATIGFLIALPLFLFEVPLPEQLRSMITLIGRMCTPVSMIIMGMRLATVCARDVFSSLRLYGVVMIKQILMPLLAFALLFFLPVDTTIKQSLYIIAACPVASVVLNFSELAGAGQKSAANLVLLGTAGSILTLPVMMLLLPLFGG